MGNLFVIRLWKRLGHFWERMVYKRKRLRGWELEKESGMLQGKPWERHLGQKGNPSWQPKLLSQTFWTDVPSWKRSAGRVLGRCRSHWWWSTEWPSCAFGKRMGVIYSPFVFACGWRWAPEQGFSFGFFLGYLAQQHELLAEPHAGAKGCQRPDTSDLIWKWVVWSLEVLENPRWILIITLWRVAWKNSKASPCPLQASRPCCGLWLVTMNIFQTLWNCLIGHHISHAGNVVLKALRVQPQASMSRKQDSIFAVKKNIKNTLKLKGLAKATIKYKECLYTGCWQGQALPNSATRSANSFRWKRKMHPGLGQGSGKTLLGQGFGKGQGGSKGVER